MKYLQALAQFLRGLTTPAPARPATLTTYTFAGYRITVDRAREIGEIESMWPGYLVRFWLAGSDVIASDQPLPTEAEQGLRHLGIMVLA